MDVAGMIQNKNFSMFSDRESTKEGIRLGEAKAKLGTTKSV
jgi:hypothetical protein